MHTQRYTFFGTLGKKPGFLYIYANSEKYTHYDT